MAGVIAKTSKMWAEGRGCDRTWPAWQWGRRWGLVGPVATISRAVSVSTVREGRTNLPSILGLNYACWPSGTRSDDCGLICSRPDDGQNKNSPLLFAVTQHVVLVDIISPRCKWANLGRHIHPEFAHETFGSQLSQNGSGRLISPVSSLACSVHLGWLTTTPQ
jgi:hypothetical protein